MASDKVVKSSTGALSREMLARRVHIGNLYTLMADTGRTWAKKEQCITEQLRANNLVKMRGREGTV